MDVSNSINMQRWA